jgi:hypothetical protein
MKQELLNQFRHTLYQNLNNRADSTMDLIDALSANMNASSVVELSLHPLFKRKHSSVYNAISEFSLLPGGWSRILRVAIPQKDRRFWLFGVDVTSAPRPYAYTLEDREFVYAPTPVKGSKPVTIGHKYSVAVLHPLKEEGSPPWVVPLKVRRVKPGEDAEITGFNQVKEVIMDKNLPFHKDLCVVVADTKYSKPEALLSFRDNSNVVSIVRVRSNRVFYRRHSPDPEEKAHRGHPRWYGEKFSLRDPETWHAPDEEKLIPVTSKKGKPRVLRIKVWKDMVMRGRKGHPMHKYPFTLVSIELLLPDGNPVYKRPIWVIVFGEQRGDIIPFEIANAYFQRFDVEHFFRFAKRRMLLTRFQTPDVSREEHWWEINILAYLQLWMAKDLAENSWRPWQRHLDKGKDAVPSPSQVQRDMIRIIRAFGTPALEPQPRGKSPGRKKGAKFRPRPRREVVKKAAKAV